MPEVTNPSQYVEECIAQYTKSRDWFNDNYYGEFAEIYRSINCRVKPLLDKNNKEITNRTNVALPDHFVMRRKKTARLAASPPNLRVRGGTSQEQRDKTTALVYRQWDLGGWQRVLRGVVDGCTTFGWNVSKTWWNKVETNKRLRRKTSTLDRATSMRLQGAPQDEIDQAIAELGPTHDETELAQLLAQFGPEVSLNNPTLKYEGPVGQALFIGDCYPEPGFQSLDKSAYIIEHSEWDTARLVYYAKMQTVDESGQVIPVFDLGAVEKMVDESDGAGSTATREKELRKILRDAISQTEPRLTAQLRGKRYDILERHSIQDDGRIRIDWIGEQGYYLGGMYYPWDTYGKYIYRELVLIPDLLGGIGQSAIRASRFLMQLRNARANQTSDFINKKLRPKFKVLDTADVQDSHFERADWSGMAVKNMGDIELLFDPTFPPEAWQDQAMLNREMQQVEPLINDFASGTETIPSSGRLATTAVFQQKSADSVTADELMQINLYLYDQLNLNLAMTQQQMNEPMTIQRGETDRIDALSLFSNGEARSIVVDPMEIQEDLELIPEAGSTLAADDEFKRNTLLQAFSLAAANPDVFNKRAFAGPLASTIPGMKQADALSDPNPPPPQPEVRFNVSVAVKWTELPADVRVALLSTGGLPTAGTSAQAVLDLTGKVNEAAAHAAELEAPPVDDPNTKTSIGGGGGGKLPYPKRPPSGVGAGSR